MSVKAVRALVLAYMIVFLLATTWPGAMMFNSVTPLILGLPFNLFMIAILIVLAIALLTALYVSEQRTRSE